MNIQLAVGAVEETITVAGASPVVDVQSVTTQTVMSREVLDVVPTGRNIQAIGILIPGTGLQVGGGAAYSVDVGGSGGMQQSPLAYHGNTNSVQQIDGIRFNNIEGAGQYLGHVLERRDDSGDPVHHERRLGRNAGRRRPHQHDSRRKAATRSAARSSATSPTTSGTANNLDRRI